MAISPLKYLIGVPLGTTTTLVSLRVNQHALLQAAPHGLHLGHARRGHGGTTRLVAQREVLHDEFCEISPILETVRLKSSQEQARMAGLHAGEREPRQTSVLHRQLE